MGFKKFYLLQANKLLSESFSINSTNIQRIYEIFRNEYIKSTGKAWDFETFRHKSQNWIFYGDENGFVAIRPQKSGFYKLVGAAGSLKSKYRGFLEIQKKQLPVWGMVSKDIANLLEKLGFRQPNFLERKFLIKLLNSNVMGNAKMGGFTNDGGAKIQYNDLGETVKYFMGSIEYWKKLYSMK